MADKWDVRYYRLSPNRKIKLIVRQGANSYWYFDAVDMKLLDLIDTGDTENYLTAEAAMAAAEQWLSKQKEIERNGG